MSKRVVAISILGVGDTSSDDAAVFTTRLTGAISSTVEGTVVSLSDQLSSEITMFGSLGSDPSTSFTILSTDVTRKLLLSRGKVPVYDSLNNQPMRLNGYVLPAAGTVEIPVLYPALFTVGNYYRIQNTVFKIVSNSPTLTGGRVWGCANLPIGKTAQDQTVGPVIYDLNGGNPLGGCEQLPVVIQTEETDGSNAEVIFRGYVNKVSNDTSAGQQNLIKVDCASMMAYIKQAPFIPAWGPVSATTVRRAGEVTPLAEDAVLAAAVTRTIYNNDVWGPQFDPANPETGKTVINMWQIREGDKGGIAQIDGYQGVEYYGTSIIKISNEVVIDYDGGVTSLNNGFQLRFEKGYYETGSIGPNVNLEVSISSESQEPEGGIMASGRSDRHTWWGTNTSQAPGIRGENCVDSANPYTLMVDLLLGCVNGQISLAQGARSVHESAWLPYEYANVDDIIDIASLLALVGGLRTPDFVGFIPGSTVNLGTSTRYLLPYEHTSAKTVGDVLDGILKRLGAYMVYDQGKFYFGSWAGPRQTPVFVNDSQFSDPSIKLTFDRGMSLMRVTAKYCVACSLGDLAALTYDVPYLNVELASSGLGKEMTIGHWYCNNRNPDDPYWGNSRLLANAFGLIMRYSQSAARVDVTLRDAVVDLEVGQEIAFSSEFIVNSKGEMGVSVLTGYVLKAARSWSTPTTAYTIILPGYLSVSNKIAVWSCSARVDNVPGGDLIQVEANAFTAPPDIASEGAPSSDAECFQLTHDLIGTWYDVQLLDQYGTLKYQGALAGVSGNYLDLPGFDAYATSGDIIVLAPATSFSAVLDDIYDVFQANDGAQVDGLTANASKWVP
jgi:hypothetical protein